MDNSYTHEQLDKVIEYIKARSSKPVYNIKATIAEDIDVTASKFGGYPYWPEDKKYPRNVKDEPLMMLAQINLDDLQPKNSKLPETGMLQFFIQLDDLYGMNFNDLTLQDSFRVVYHENVDEDVAIYSLRERGIKTSTDLDNALDSSPIVGELALTFEAGEDCMNSCIEGFEGLMQEALRETLGVETAEKSWQHFDSESYGYLAKHTGNGGHKMLGYPFFTQEDPRENPQEEFDVLLLQIDSQGDDILWGDIGVGNFFISSRHLENLNFRHVMYTWDCG